jgi:hypothetical protein
MICNCCGFTRAGDSTDPRCAACRAHVTSCAPRLTPAHVQAVNFIRCFTVPAPPEEDGPDPDHGF